MREEGNRVTYQQLFDFAKEETSDPKPPKLDPKLDPEIVKEEISKGVSRLGTAKQWREHFERLFRHSTNADLSKQLHDALQDSPDLAVLLIAMHEASTRMRDLNDSEMPFNLNQVRDIFAAEYGGGMKEVKVDSVNGDTVILQGKVLLEEMKERAELIASAFVGKDNVINALQVYDPMIEMDVLIAEVNWSDVKSLGNNDLFNSLGFDLNGQLSWDSVFNKQSVNDDPFTQIVTGASGGSAENSTTNTPAKETITRNHDNTIKARGLTVTARSSLNALLEADCARIIGKPHITVRSGKSAEVHVGGTYGTALITRDTQLLEFITYGTILEIKPTLRQDGKIYGEVRIVRSDRPVPVPFPGGEISDALDYAVSETTSNIVMTPRQTLVLSGLLQTDMFSLASKTPFLHRIPGLNMFFKEKSSQVIKRELIVLVTPSIEPTIFSDPRNWYWDPKDQKNWMFPYSKEGERKYKNKNGGLKLDRHVSLNDSEATDFLFNREYEEWPCRGCGLRTCRLCCPTLNAAGIGKSVFVGRSGTKTVGLIEPVYGYADSGSSRENGILWPSEDAYAQLSADPSRSPSNTWAEGYQNAEESNALSPIRLEAQPVSYNTGDGWGVR